MARPPHRPICRYHGGKWMLASWIIAHLPPHRVYTEVYGGAASVLVRKARSYNEVYNDVDEEIVNLFRVLRDPAQAARLAEAVALTPFARVEFEASYTPHPDPVEQARRTLLRAAAGFAATGATGQTTGFRTGATGYRSSVPARDWANYPPLIPAFVERLRGVVIDCRPALEVLAEFDGPDTLHYVDPPYPHETRNSHDLNRGEARVYKREMTEGDHRTLASALSALAGMVVISGYPCELYDVELYPDWQRVERVALIESGARRVEVLWLSPRAAEALAAHRAAEAEAALEVARRRPATLRLFDH